MPSNFSDDILNVRLNREDGAAHFGSDFLWGAPIGKGAKNGEFRWRQYDGIVGNAFPAHDALRQQQVPAVAPEPET